MVNTSSNSPKASANEKQSMLSRVEAHGIEWIDVQEPHTAKLKEMQKEYGFHPLDLEDTLSPVQRPKLEMQKDYVFLVFRFPLVSKKTKRLHAIELDVFLYKNKLITFHSRNAKMIRSIMSDAKLFKDKRDLLLGNGPGHLLYEILKRLFEQSFALTDQISLELEKLEARIFKNEKRNSVINEISGLRRIIIDFRKIAKPQSSFLKHVVDSVNGYVGETEELFWRNLMELADNQWEILETHKETIDGLATTNDSLVSNRLNITFRLLTIISVIFIPITFLLDIISTDIPGNPLVKFEPIFLVVVGALFITEVGFIWYLKRKGVL